MVSSLIGHRVPAGQRRTLFAGYPLQGKTERVRWEGPLRADPKNVSLPLTIWKAEPKPTADTNV